MSPIAGVAGPIGLNFFVGTHEGPPRLKIKYIFFSNFFLSQNFVFNFFFHGQRRALQLVVNSFACKLFNIFTILLHILWNHKK